MTLLEVLTAVKSTLNEIQVKGEDNLDRLLGSIRAVGNCITTLSTPPASDTMTQEPEPVEAEPEEGNNHADPDPE